MATFLGMDVEDYLKQESINACHFNKMSKEKTLYPDRLVMKTYARSAQTGQRTEQTIWRAG